MEFLRKQWTKIILIVLSLAGLVLMLINIFTMGTQDITPTFMAQTIYIGYITFFIGTIGFMVCRMLDFVVSRTVCAWILAATGLVTTVFMTLALIHAIDLGGRFVIFPVVAQLVVFGLFPLLVGVNRLVKVTDPTPTLVSETE